MATLEKVLAPTMRKAWPSASTAGTPPACVALRCVALRCAALRCVVLRCVALRCIALLGVALRCVAVRNGTGRDGTARCGNGAEAMLAVKAIMALLARKAKLAFPPLKQLGPQPLPPLGRGGHMFL